MVRTFKRVSREKKIKQAPVVSYLVPVMVFLDAIPNDKMLYRYLFPEGAEIISFVINLKGLKSKMEIVLDLKVEGGGEYAQFEVDEGPNELLESRIIVKHSTVELSVPDYTETLHGNPQIWISYLYRIVMS